MAAYWVSHDHLEEKLAPFVQAHRAHTITPLALLRVHFKIGYLSTERSDRKKPYAATDAHSQTVRDWEWHVNQVMPAGYLARTHRFRRLRETGDEIDYFRLIDRTVELPDTEGTSREAGVHAKPVTYLTIGHASHGGRTDCADTRLGGVMLLSGESSS